MQETVKTIAQYVLWAVVAITALLIFGNAISSCSERQDRVLAERRAAQAHIDSLVPRERSFEYGDAVPIRVIELEDKSQLLVIGDYRQPGHVVMQRTAVGWVVVHPSNARAPLDAAFLQRLEK